MITLYCLRTRGHKHLYRVAYMMWVHGPGVTDPRLGDVWWLHGARDATRACTDGIGVLYLRHYNEQPLFILNKI
jgi:hypothetical protein